jgi:hypothetical protein
MWYNIIMEKTMEPTNEQREKINQLWEELYDLKEKTYLKTCTIKDLFPDTIPAGDFRWGNDADPGDPYPYACCEYDCEEGWHMAYYNDVFGRENGKLFIEIFMGDEDGNWEFDDGWEEGADPIIEKEICNTLAQRSDQYFIHWCRYWLECAMNPDEILEEGKDPLDQIIEFPEPDKLIDFLIDAAEKNIEYLKM